MERTRFREYGLVARMEAAVVSETLVRALRFEPDQDDGVRRNVCRELISGLAAIGMRPEIVHTGCAADSDIAPARGDFGRRCAAIEKAHCESAAR